MTAIEQSDGVPHLDDGRPERALYWGVGSRITVRLSAQHTGGKVGVTHFSAPVGEAAPLHQHTKEDELFLVAAGQVEITVDGDTRTVTGGGVAYLPRGSAHRYTVLAPGTEFFVVTLPGGFERFFTAGGLDPRGRDDRQLAAMWSRDRINEIEQELDIGLRWLTAADAQEESK